LGFHVKVSEFMFLVGLICF